MERVLEQVALGAGLDGAEDLDAGVRKANRREIQTPAGRRVGNIAVG